MNPTDQPGTHLIALGGIMSPLWLTHMSQISQEWLPILGAGWLVLQASVFAYKNVLKPLWLNWRGLPPAKLEEPKE